MILTYLYPKISLCSSNFLIRLFPESILSKYILLFVLKTINWISKWKNKFPNDSLIIEPSRAGRFKDQESWLTWTRKWAGSSSPHRSHPIPSPALSYTRITHTLPTVTHLSATWVNEQLLNARHCDENYKSKDGSCTESTRSSCSNREEKTWTQTLIT